MAKPAALKAKGTRINKNEPVYADAIFTPPEDLDAEERKCWDGLVPHLEAAGTVKVTDLPLLTDYCIAATAFRRHVALWKQDPANNKYPTPMMAPLNSMRASLGITPVSRQKIVAMKEEEDDKSALAFLQG